ncbi:MAG: HK97 gp10 family phage protein [Chitinophagaceae bacterium]|nr:HK97 gp10 family phage protein [Chitinophagaceae bacterium]
MAAFNIQIKGLNEITTRFKEFPKEVEAVVQKNLNEFAVNTASDAQGFCPVNEGHLRQSIHPEIKRLEAGVTVSANYAAYVEFGSRGYAAQYVATLPAEWQEFAAKFKGKGGGTFAELLERITEWVRHKNIGIQLTKSGKSSKSASSLAAQKQAAYLIARKILRNGVKAQPFLMPAVESNRIKLEENLKRDFNT